MTRADQQAFAEELLSRITEHVRERIARVPAEWDGWEIRQWVTDVVQDQFGRYNKIMTTKRKRAYTNARITESL